MGIFFRSFPSKKEVSGTPKSAPAKPEPKKTGDVSDYELKKRTSPISEREFERKIRPELIRKLGRYDEQKIENILSGHMDKDRGERFKNLTPKEAEEALKYINEHAYRLKISDKDLQNTRESLLKRRG